MVSDRRAFTGPTQTSWPGTTTCSTSPATWSYVLSNGAGAGNNDKGNDLDVLQQWHALPGSRNVAYFGDNASTALNEDSAEGASYLSAVMGVEWSGEDVRDAIGGQIAPVVTASPYGSAWFVADVVATGSCRG